MVCIKWIDRDGNCSTNEQSGIDRHPGGPAIAAAERAAPRARIVRERRLRKSAAQGEDAQMKRQAHQQLAVLLEARPRNLTQKAQGRLQGRKRNWANLIVQPHKLTSAPPSLDILLRLFAPFALLRLGSVFSVHGSRAHCGLPKYGEEPGCPDSSQL